MVETYFRLLVSDGSSFWAFRVAGSRRQEEGKEWLCVLVVGERLEGTPGFKSPWPAVLN